MLYGKFDRYILIAILAVAVLAVILIFLTRKENNDHHDSQDDLLLAMAEKLRVAPTVHESVHESKGKAPIQSEPTEEEEEAIIGIADKICFNQPLTQEEKALQAKFPKQTKLRVDQSRQILGNIINKFLEGTKDFDEYEKEFYEAFQEHIDNIINFKKMADAIALKISSGATEFSDEELQFQKNHAKQIEAALLEIKKNKGPEVNGSNPGKSDPAGKGSEGMSGANPPISADERLKIILSIFEDGIPKTVTDIAKLYADKAKTNFNKGNMSKVLGKIVDAGQLMCEKLKTGKVYHGPPSWFENKKLKTHYKQNIQA